jgi:hypothetical protein
LLRAHILFLQHLRGDVNLAWPSAAVTCGSTPELPAAACSSWLGFACCSTCVVTSTWHGRLLQ